MLYMPIGALIPTGPTSRHRLGRFVRRGLWWVGGLLLASLALVGASYLLIQRGGNFHAVESGLVYRSAQPGAEALRQAVATHGIKAVLNLRGGNAGKPWYDEEVRAARTLGIQHLDLRLSAYHDLSVAQMDDIVKLIQDAPKPLLIHCESGADRTGLVSALYRLSRGQSGAAAAQELAPRYGHVVALVPRSAAMDRSLEAYLQSGRGPKLATR
ncbi:MAG: protein tyrosine phosphatase [Rubrivivax sp.]|nr:MAG: protein tyrosine phosphatase [Rubrivivax sp.]